jgi:hypothetical protein
MVFNDDFNSENQMYIYNNLGQEIYVTITNANNHILADLSNLDNGLYLIKISGKKGKIYQNKIIKIR